MSPRRSRRFSRNARRFLLALVLLVGPASIADAGVCIAGAAPADYHHEFQLFAGYSPQSATLIGTTTDRRFVAAGFDYSYRCWAWSRVSASFTAGIMPAAILIQPSETLLASISSDSYYYRTVPSHAVYGFGVTPVGFTVDFWRNRSFYPFFQTDEGVIASAQRIPENVTDATALNFLFDLGGGIKWHPGGSRYAFTAGYKFLHISNAFTTPVNPGVDNNLIYVGFSLLR